MAKVYEILKFPEHRARAVTVSDVGVSTVDGRKIMPAGTIIGGADALLREDESQMVVNKNTSELADGAEGVLLYDVDVTNGPQEGAMLFEGDIDLNKLQEAPVAEVELKSVRFWAS